MRGTRPWRDCLSTPVGIIPAHAGNTQQSGFRLKLHGDHPRACGEHGLDGVQLTLQAGSSPRMRGTHQFTDADIDCVRIIPAHAGNTGRARLSRADTRDHPRACGEHFGCDWLAFSCQGSSPRMRGTPITPPRHTSTARDHPRACGEHYAYDSADITGMGSSPRMRGTLQASCMQAIGFGIIPAHAGNTCY